MGDVRKKQKEQRERHAGAAAAVHDALPSDCANLCVCFVNTRKEQVLKAAEREEHKTERSGVLMMVLGWGGHMQEVLA